MGKRSGRKGRRDAAPLRAAERDSVAAEVAAALAVSDPASPTVPGGAVTPGRRAVAAARLAVDGLALLDRVRRAWFDATTVDQALLLLEVCGPVDEALRALPRLVTGGPPSGELPAVRDAVVVLLTDRADLPESLRPTLGMLYASATELELLGHLAGPPLSSSDRPDRVLVPTSTLFQLRRALFLPSGWRSGPSALTRAATPSRLSTT